MSNTSLVADAIRVGSRIGHASGMATIAMLSIMSARKRDSVQNDAGLDMLLEESVRAIESAVDTLRSLHAPIGECPADSFIDKKKEAPKCA